MTLINQVTQRQLGSRFAILCLNAPRVILDKRYRWRDFGKVNDLSLTKHRAAARGKACPEATLNAPRGSLAQSPRGARCLGELMP
jgi:hypothetical protein